MEMDALDNIIPDIINLILDFVGDTRGYSCVSKCAHEQAATRPDHTVWQKIHTLADHFIHGTTATVTWALSNVLELATLDDIGLAVALANALQADNVAVVEVIIPRVTDEYWLNRAAWCCGATTYKLFNVDWKKLKLTRCGEFLAEVGVDFENALYDCDEATDIDDLFDIVSNTRLTDKYLCTMLPDAIIHENLDVWLLDLACIFNRRDFALEIVKRYGTDCAIIVLNDLNLGTDGSLDTCKVRLIDELSAISDCKYDRDALRENNIMRGLVEELDPAGVEQVHELERQIINGDAKIETLKQCGGKMLNLIARHSSDDTVRDLFYDDEDMEIALSKALVNAGRHKLAQLNNCSIDLLFSSRTTAEWATRSKKYSRSAFVGASIDAYILCDRFGGFCD